MRIHASLLAISLFLSLAPLLSVADQGLDTTVEILSSAILNASPSEWSAVAKPDVARNLALSPVNNRMVVIYGDQSTDISEDAGLTWSNRNQQLSGKKVFNLVASGTGDFFAATWSGLYRLKKDENVWSNVAPKDVRLFSESPNAQVQAFISGRSLFRSLDGGSFWSCLTTNLPVSEWSYEGLAVVDQNTFLISLYDFKVLQTTNAGVTFSASGKDQGLMSSSPTTFLVDRANCSRIFVGSYWHGVYRSQNGGSTWAPSNAGLPTGRGVDKLWQGSDNAIYALVDDQESTLGIYRSRTNGDSWEHMTDCLPFVKRNACFSMAVNASGKLFGAFGMWGLMARDSQDPEWSNLNTGRPHGMPLDVSLLSTDSTGRIFCDEQSGGGIFVSEDEGQTWSVFGDESYNCRQQPPIQSLLSDTDGYTYASLYMDGVVRTTDGGKTWTDPSGFSFPSSPTKLISANNRLYVGSYGTGVHVSPDQATTWFPFTNGLAKTGVREMAVNGYGRAICLCWGAKDQNGNYGAYGIYRTTASNDAWETGNDDMPSSDAVKLSGLGNGGAGTCYAYGSAVLYRQETNTTAWVPVVRPESSDVQCVIPFPVGGTLIGTSRGVFYRNERLGTWARVGGNLLNSTSIIALTVSQNGTVRAVTSSGIYSCVFTIPASTVTGLTPTHGSVDGGSSVLINGTGFTGATSVDFGTKAAASFTVNSDTQITAIAPSGTAGQTVNVSVTTVEGTSTNTAADDYYYDPLGPTGIILSNTNVVENLALGTKVGSFIPQGFYVAHPVLYALSTGTGDTDNGSFTISGSNLLTAAVFDYGTKNRYSIRIRVTDQNGYCFENVFIITVYAVWGDFAYEVNVGGTTITITDYIGEGGAVSIPTSLEGLTVTSIGNRAFEGCSNVTRVIVPGCIVSIGSSAFSYCTSLTDVTIGNSVTNIASQVFAGCANLLSVTIGTGLANIENSAFLNCTGLRWVYFQGNAPNVGSDVMQNANNATVYYLPGKSGWGATFAGRPSMRLPYAYMTVNNTVTITNYTGTSGAVDIPSIIEGKSVVGIGANAFKNFTGLTGVTIPGSVINIGGYAFYNCSGLTNVMIGSSVTNIGDYSFSGCSKLSNVTIPNNVTRIGNWAFFSCSILTNALIGSGVTGISDYAFFNCTGLNSVAIPDSVMTIGSAAFSNCSRMTNAVIGRNVTNNVDQAFSSCTGLTAITVSVSNMNYSSVDGVLFNKSQTRLLRCPEGKFGSFTIPSSVTQIVSSAFYRCKALVNVTIPTGVNSINGQTFSECNSLASVVIPSSVITIGDWAFSVCISLVNVTIPDSVTNIGISAFNGCANLPSVTIGSGVKSIGNSAFGSCSSLTSINVSSANTSYGSKDGVLFNKNLTSLIQYPSGKMGSYTIPATVTNIGDSAFYACAGLTVVTIPNGVVNIGSLAFSRCYSLNSVLLGNGVTSIGGSGSAFSYCTNLVSVTIPASVTNIANYVFSNCTRLSNVYFTGKAPSLGGSSVFSGANNVTIYYLPGTTGWGTTFGGRQTLLWNPQIPSDTSFGVLANRFGFNITGTTNIPIIVEACTNLAGGVWTPMLTNKLGTSGSFYFSDPAWTNGPARFYRIRAP